MAATESGAERFRVPVGESEASVLYESAASSGSLGVLVFAHGAGSHMDHRMTAGFAELFRGCGLDIVRFNFLYRESGRGSPDRMPRLIECYSAVVQQVRKRMRPARLLIGGQSMGGRTATMMAADGFDCDGLLLTAYPLHPAGRPEKLRDAHLPRIEAPVLCFNGTRDALCERERMQRVVAGLSGSWTMHWIEGADHGFRVLKRSGRTDADVREELAQAARAWLTKTFDG